MFENVGWLISLIALHCSSFLVRPAPLFPTVCLEDYDADDDVRILDCRHCFHQQCVDRWLSQGANTCPACRTMGVKPADQQQQETSEATRNESPEIRI